MPYVVEHDKKSKKFIVKKRTGEIVAHHKTMGDAQAQMRLLHGIEHGWKPTGKKRKAASEEGEAEG